MESVHSFSTYDSPTNELSSDKSLNHSGFQLTHVKYKGEVGD